MNLLLFWLKFFADEDCDSSPIYRMDSHFTHSGASKNRIFPSASISDSESDDSAETRVASTFQPLHLISKWLEPGTTTRFLSLAIAFSSGVGSGDFSVHVWDGGREIELSTTWPKGLQDLKYLHKKWLSGLGRTCLELYHPKYI